MTYRSLKVLAQAGLIGKATDLRAVEEKYAIAVTPDLAALIDPAAAHDPIGAQFLPSTEELNIGPMELVDPIGDHVHEQVPGVIHRYPDRVLLKIVAVCPVYCRFCFRREMVGPGKEKNLTPTEIDAALEYVRAHPEVWEVILTGGDPFMLSPARAKTVTEALDAIPHVKVIRWHTRMPVADPARVSPDFIEAVKATQKAVYVAIHTNHARELTPAARRSIDGMANAGLALLSQSVLLRGVNDDIDTLSDLMRELVALRVKPYYIHQLDYAPGTSHFRVDLAKAQNLMRDLRDRLSGLCQPQFVIDIPGGVSKAVATPADISADGAALRGRDDQWYVYPPPG